MAEAIRGHVQFNIARFLMKHLFWDPVRSQLKRWRRVCFPFILCKLISFPLCKEQREKIAEATAHECIIFKRVPATGNFLFLFDRPLPFVLLDMNMVYFNYFAQIRRFSFSPLCSILKKTINTTTETIHQKFASFLGALQNSSKLLVANQSRFPLVIQRLIKAQSGGAIQRCCNASPIS